MKKSKLFLISFLCSAGAALYVFLISLFMNSNLLNSTSEKAGIPIVLLLFVFSALITALLILGYPIWLYFEQKKKEAVLAVAFNAGWLFIFLAIAIAAVIIC